MCITDVRFSTCQIFRPARFSKPGRSGRTGNLAGLETSIIGSLIAGDVFLMTADVSEHVPKDSLTVADVRQYVPRAPLIVANHPQHVPMVSPIVANVWQHVPGVSLTVANNFQITAIVVLIVEHSLSKTGNVRLNEENGSPQAVEEYKVTGKGSPFREG